MSSKLRRSGEQAAIMEGQLSVLLYHCLRGTPDSIEHCTERIELGFFTRVSHSVLSCLNVAGRVILFNKVHGPGGGRGGGSYNRARI
jgi:hypothetical protein